MKKKFVSKSLSSMDYDENKRELTLYFRSSSKEVLFDVPLTIARQLATAASPGTFYQNEISGIYKSTVVRQSLWVRNAKKFASFAIKITIGIVFGLSFRYFINHLNS